MFTTSLSKRNCGIGSGMGMEGGENGSGVAAASVGSMPGRAVGEGVGERSGVGVAEKSVPGTGVVSAPGVEGAEDASVALNGGVHVGTGVRAAAVGEGVEVHPEAKRAVARVSSRRRFMGAYCSPF
jgi:hypothetical protein